MLPFQDFGTCILFENGTIYGCMQAMCSMTGPGTWESFAPRYYNTKADITMVYYSFFFKKKTTYQAGKETRTMRVKSQDNEHEIYNKKK